MNDEPGSCHYHAAGDAGYGGLRLLGPVGRSAAAAVLAVAGWLSLSTLAPPDEVSSAYGFSLERALADVERIAGEPRPVGSAAHDRARQYLLDEIGRAGLEVEVQEAVVPSGGPPGAHRLMRVRNVIARMPGRGEGDGVMLAAHYDSVPAAPGAGDDAAGMAALLETMRVMAGEGPPGRDVIFLFTDAEEMGLLGARAFVDAGLAGDVGWVVNVEGRGAGGASIMFETLPGDVEAMRFFANASPKPAASSYSYDVYRRMPNDTDFSVFREVIPAGYNFAFIEDPAAYHSSVDTPERLDRNSLLHHGVQALALARGLAASPPDVGGERAVYFSLPGYGLAVYPAAWDSYIAILISILAVIVIGIGLYRQRLSPVRLMVGLGAVLTGIAVPVAALMALDWVWTEGLGLGPDTKGVLTLYGYSWVLVAAGAAWLSATWLGRRVGIVHLATAAAIFWTLLAGLSAYFLASSAFLFTWPALFVWLALLLVVINEEGDTRWIGPVVLACALPTVLIWLPTLKGLAVALGPVAGALGVATALPVLLLSLQASLLAGPVRGAGLLPGLVLATGLGAFGWAAVNAGPSPSHPRADSLVYALDAGTGEAVWASYDDEPDDWTRRILGDDPPRRALPGFFNDELELMTAPAQALPLSAPEIELVDSEALEAGGRRVTLALRSPRQAPVMEVSIEPDDGLRRAWVDGKPLEAAGSFRLSYHAVPPDGIRLVLETDGEGPIDLAVVDGSYGLPASLIPEGRPESFQPRRFPWAVRDRRFPVSDTTLVRAQRRIQPASTPEPAVGDR